MAVTKKPSQQQGLVTMLSDAIGFFLNAVCLDAGAKLYWFAQMSSNLPGGMAANESLNVVALPAIAAGAEGTVTVSNTQITNTSVILAGVFNQNTDTTAGARVTVDVRPPTAGSVVLHYKSDVLMSAAWACWYLVID